MKRRQFIKNTLFTGAALALAPFSSLAAKDESLTILYTNDWHSRIDPFPMDGGRNQGLGGAAKRAAMIKEIKAQNKNVLLLDAGDIFQGTPYFNLYGGELEFKLMSLMGYDAATMGNHDFDAGIEGFDKQLKHANFPFLVANYDFDDTILKNKIASYKIFNKGPYKIGVFGLGIELEGLVPKNSYGNTKYLNPIPIANKIATDLKQNHKCDLVICLSHLGYQYKGKKVSDVLLAENSNNIDVILGGHTHTFLKNPHKIINNSKEISWICQTGWAGINLGRIDFKSLGKMTSAKPHFTMLQIC